MVILTVPDVLGAVVVGYSEAVALRRAHAILDSILQGYAAEGCRPRRCSRAGGRPVVLFLRRLPVA
jgi:hypothetical protein